MGRAAGIATGPDGCGTVSGARVSPSAAPATAKTITATELTKVRLVRLRRPRQLLAGPIASRRPPDAMTARGAVSGRLGSRRVVGPGPRRPFGPAAPTRSTSLAGEATRPAVARVAVARVAVARVCIAECGGWALRTGRWTTGWTTEVMTPTKRPRLAVRMTTRTARNAGRLRAGPAGLDAAGTAIRSSRSVTPPGRAGSPSPASRALRWRSWATSR